MRVTATTDEGDTTAAHGQGGCKLCWWPGWMRAADAAPDKGDGDWTTAVVTGG